MTRTDHFQILHGDHTVASREQLGKIIATATANNHRLIRLGAKKMTLAELEDAFASQSLFPQATTVIIEELHSLPKSKRQAEVLTALASWNNQPTLDTDVVLWEKRQLTATMLKKFPQAQVAEYKLSKSLWQWLDSLSGSATQPQRQTSTKLLSQALIQDGEVFVFTMLCRQIRLLITVKETGTTAGAPFMVTKLKKQAGQFSLTQLLSIHHHLLAMDLAFKSSGSLLTLGQQLDLLIATM